MCFRCFVCCLLRMGNRYSTISSAKELQRGDHISYPTQRMPSLHHHAIVVHWTKGTWVHVIHATDSQVGGSSGSSGSSAKVSEEDVDLEEHIRNKTLTRYNYLWGECYRPDKVIRRARNHIGIFHYDALNQNCEHLARYWKTGRYESIQANVVSTILWEFARKGLGSIGSLKWLPTHLRFYIVNPLWLIFYF